MDEAMKNLMAGKKGKKSQRKTPTKQAVEEREADEKINKSIRMKESTFLLLKKVTNRIEEESGKYTQEDAILDGLTLLAKQKGIEA